MKPFAQLLEELVTTSGRVAKLSLLATYFRETPDPDRGYALAALTDGLRVPQVTPRVFRALVEERVDPVLFRLSHDFVGDLAETLSLIWPEAPGAAPPPRLGEVVARLNAARPAERPALLAALLDAMGPSERFALVKLCAGGPRVGVSGRLARLALAETFGRPVGRIEEFWHALTPPYAPLWRWLEGGPEPSVDFALAFRPMMLAQPIDALLGASVAPEEPPDEAETDEAAPDAALLARLEARLAPSDFAAEWKWDGVRIQAVAGPSGRALFSRAGEDLGPAFPDILEAMDWAGCVDGELLVGRPDTEAPFAVASFAELQKRLGRKRVTARDRAERPAFIRAYDLLHDGREDLRPLPFETRRARLERWLDAARPPRLDLSPLVPFADWADLAALRGGARAAAQEGLMLKRRAGAYLPGRPMGEWFKWKRAPMVADCVLVYAQRGHGKRSSYYSDFTFAAWADSPEGPALLPVGKAYSGFTDAELLRLDRFVRENTLERYGPVRAVAPALVLEVAFDAVQRSTRHRSGLALRFPRIRRIRWDKPASEADRVDTLLLLADASAQSLTER